MRILSLMLSLSFGTNLDARQIRQMFNAYDSCRSWSAKKTAVLLVRIEKSGEQFEFSESHGVVTLQNKESGVAYAIFYETASLCKISKIKRP